MEIISFNRNETSFGSEFINDYYSPKFQELRTYDANIEAIAAAIERKKSFPSDKRLTLVDVLFKQYSTSNIKLLEDSLVSKNIKLLKEATTFTVTTGQQIHIGLGPLYVAYKSLETIAICRELKLLHPAYNFVPVFWMATEDHDLEEIQTITAFGKTFFWQTSQTGAVGRMNTDGVVKLFEQIEEELNLDGDQKEFVELCKLAYANNTLASAFRQVLHHYFAEQGLVILDGDNEILKQSFSPVLVDELQAKNAEALQKSTKALVELGYQPQIITRDINLFSLNNSQRLKITKKSNVWKDEAGNELFTEARFQEEFIGQEFNLSPNAALRPLYQEWVLPNLVYVGGGAEVKYWLQLKGLFDNYNLPMPLVHLRASAIILPKKRLEKLQIESLFDFFLADHDLVIKYGDELSVLREAFYVRFETIVDEFNLFSADFEKAFAGASVKRKIEKIIPKIKELEEITQHHLLNKANSNSNLDKILKLKMLFFNNSKVQERSEHFFAHLGTIKGLTSSHDLCFGFKNQQKISVILT